MDLDFKEAVWKGQFRPTEESFQFEDGFRKKFGLGNRYESARLLIGRSLAEPQPVAPLGPEGKLSTKAIAGEFLFGDQIDLWMSALVLDGQLGTGATVDDFRALAEAHWARGYQLLRDELEQCGGDEVRLISRLADLLPEGLPEGMAQPGLDASTAGEVRVKVGSVSRTHPGDKPVELVLNGQGTSPHIALMGSVGKGKTTTAVQMAQEIIANAQIPFLFIDPKGDEIFRRAVEPLGGTIIEVGREPIPLDFLPAASVGRVSVQNAAMRLRDTIVRCCKTPGDLQQDLLRTAIENVIQDEAGRDLATIKDAYEQQLHHAGKGNDSIVSRLNELTGLSCFSPDLQPAQFFRRSWVISLKALQSDELKRLVILLVLDSTAAYILSQEDSPVVNGFRSLRHILVVDEARKILMERKYQSLSDLVRLSRSKGEVMVLLSQDPSDFEGQVDDFTTQLGSVVAFACAQTQRGLRALRGVYGRALQANEFADTWLPQGVAFCKLPGREPERISCWQPTEARET
jgi:DNA sulfur modification protein DndE